MGILMGRELCLGREPTEWASIRRTCVMAENNKTQKNRTGATLRSKAKGPAEKPFDQWLQKQLHAMYDEIASEPLPVDLVNLIESDARKGKAGQGKK